MPRKNLFRRSVSAFVLMLLAVSLSSAGYLRNVPSVIRQPDGRVIYCYVTGDERCNWLHDARGYLILRDVQSGYFVYGQVVRSVVKQSSLLVGDGDPMAAGLKPTAESEIYRRPPASELDKLWATGELDNPVKLPTKGHINNLVVFVRFSDNPEFTDRATFMDTVFNTRIPRNPFDVLRNLSMREYFDETSYKLLDVQSYFYPKPALNIVSFQDSHPQNYYQPLSVSSIGYSTGTELRLREHGLLKRACDAIASQVDTSIDIDVNKDGYVDNIIFVLCGYPSGGSPSGPGSIIWPHMWVLSTDSSFIHGKKVWTYNVQFHYSFPNLYTPLSPSSLAHEFLHSLGLTEMYRLNDNVFPSPFDVMGSGTSHPSAYTKYRYLKWIDQMPQITKNGTYTLAPLVSPGRNCYRVASPNSSTEYFVLEYRARGYDLYHSPLEWNMPTQGLLVYRINTTLDGLGNASGPPDEVYVYRPNGTLTAKGDITRAGFCADSGKTQFNGTTNPACLLSDGKPGGLDIYNVGYCRDSLTFSIRVTPEASFVDDRHDLPTKFELAQNYPNPFNPNTTISYSLPRTAYVSLRIFGALGQEVASLMNERKDAGYYQATWNANVPSGIYFYRFQAGEFVETKKMIVLR